MTNQEVIEILEWMRGKHYRQLTREKLEAIDLAIYAVQKEIAQPPHPMKYEPLKSMGWKWACPNCKAGVGVVDDPVNENFTDEYDYCSECGQRLNWRGLKR